MTIAFAVAAVCIVALRAAALGGIGADAPRAGGALAPIESAGGALAFYLPRAVVPLPASPYVDRVAGGLSAWAGLGAALAIAFFGAILVLRGGRMSAQARAADRAGGGSSARGAGSAMDCASADRLAGTGLVSFLLFLIPSLGPAVMKVSTVPVAERYLYLPTAMLALAAAGGLARLLAVRPRWGRAALAATAAAALVLGAVSFGRTRIWKDDLSLWRSAVTTTDAAPPRIYLATALVESERLDEAESIYAGLLSGPGPLDARQRALATMNLGIVRRMRGDDEGALLRFEEAARLDPAAPLAWYNLATTLWETALLDPAKGTADAAKVSRALDAIQRARALSPLDAKILLFLGQAQATLGQRRQARASLERAAQLDPGGVVGSQARLILARLGPED